MVNTILSAYTVVCTVRLPDPNGNDFRPLPLLFVILSHSQPAQPMLTLLHSPSLPLTYIHTWATSHTYISSSMLDVVRWLPNTHDQFHYPLCSTPRNTISAWVACSLLTFSLLDTDLTLARRPQLLTHAITLRISVREIGKPNPYYNNLLQKWSI